MADLEVIYHFFRDAVTKVLKLRPKDGVPSSPKEPIHTLYRDADTGVMKTRGLTGSSDGKEAIGTLFRDDTGVLKARVPLGKRNCICDFCEAPDVFHKDYYDTLDTGPGGAPLPDCPTHGVQSDQLIPSGIVNRCLIFEIENTPTHCACFDGRYGPLQRVHCRDYLLAVERYGAVSCPGIVHDPPCDDGGGVTAVCGGVDARTDIGTGKPNTELNCTECTHCSDAEGITPDGERPNLCCARCKFTSWALGDPPGSAGSDPCYEYTSPIANHQMLCWNSSSSRYELGCPGPSYEGCESSVEISLGSPISTLRSRQALFGCLDEIVDAAIDSCINDKSIPGGQAKQKRFNWKYETGGGAAVGSCNRCTDCLRGDAEHTRDGLRTTPVREQCPQSPPLCANMTGTQSQTMEVTINAFCYGETEDGVACSNGHVWAHLRLGATYRNYLNTGSAQDIDAAENFSDECDRTKVPVGQGCSSECDDSSPAGDFDCCPPTSTVPCPDPCSPLDVTAAVTDRGFGWDTAGGPCSGSGVNDFTGQVHRFMTDCTGKAVALETYLVPAGRACSPGIPSGFTIPLVSHEPYWWSGGVYPPGASDTYLGPIINLTLFSPDDDSSCQYVGSDGNVKTATCPAFDTAPIN